MRNFSVFFSLLLGFFVIPIPLQAGPDRVQKRSFRPVVPIKQNVSADEAGQMRSQTVKVRIPPPPIPDAEHSLFPEETISNVKFVGPADASLSDAPPEPTLSEDPKPEVGGSDTPQEKPEVKKDGPTLEKLRAEAHKLSTRGLKYSFGAANPKTGGLDCSGAMQYLLKKIGVKDVPRTSYDQYYWLKNKKLLDDVHGRNASKKLFEKLSPGDLIFWGGTWKSGHKVSHVMLYMGYDPKADTHYIFGARGKTSKGMFGNGVDLFELEPNRGRLIAHGKIPGLQY